VTGEPARRIGPYAIVGVLGEGGAGIVYEAIQDSPQRTVALKVLRTGFASEASMNRFRHEAEVLGWLDHVGVARVYEAGTAVTEDGDQPFIAMELVRGERLDRYAEASQLSLPQRLDLLADLCDAVHHAHQKGVVHRDLKPANVLVTAAGQLKVLDFGIARITDADLESSMEATRTGEVLGTLPYMSPEQVASDRSQIDTRTDVYALGAIAYELLAGQRPLDLAQRGLAEAARAITEDEPTTLGALDRRLRGDVEVIVGKALAKDKEQRYASAEELASDVRRHLADEPILARRPSRWYQLRKLARRNRGLAAGVVASFVVLIAGTATAATLSQQKRRLIDEKTVQVRTAEEAISFLEGLFEQTDPFADEDLTVREVTRRAVGRIGDELRDDPRTRARLLTTLGGAFRRMFLPDEAAPALEEALAIRAEEYGEDTVEYAETLTRLAQVRSIQGRADEALAMQERVLEIRRARLGDSGKTAEAMSDLALLMTSAGRPEGAVELTEAALAIKERVLGDDHIQTWSTRHSLGLQYYHAGRFAEAEELLRAFLEAVSRDRADRLLGVSTQLQLSYVLRETGRVPEAIEMQRRAVARAEQHGGEASDASLRARQTLAATLSTVGETDEAVELIRSVHAATHAKYGPESPQGLSSTFELAFVTHELPDKREAESAYLDAIDGMRRVHGPDWPGLFEAQHNLSVLYLDLGRLDEAMGFVRDALDGRIRVQGDEHFVTSLSYRHLATLLWRMAGRERDEDRRSELYGECEQIRRKLVELNARDRGDDAQATLTARLDLASLLIETGELDEADELIANAEARIPELAEPDQLAGQAADARARLERARAGAR
jgi:tetratricopeptide (TPR) repeat protein/predicted Ser/Thr protein kinase